jgi:dTDP-4-dehydrorhamnose 3,5-epimerase
MKIYKTKLKNVLKIKLSPFKDHRGKYLEIFNKELFKKTKKKINFIQDDISISKKKVLRGVHGDYRTWKLITCLYGEFILLIINNKKKDEEYKKSEFFYLNDKNNIQILVPPGFGNAHYVKSKEAIFHYKQSTLYNRKTQFTIKWNSKEYNLKWPFKKNPITSKRDRA